MFTFVLLGFFVLLGIGFVAVAYSSSMRRRSGQRGVDPSMQGRSTK